MDHTYEISSLACVLLLLLLKKRKEIVFLPSRVKTIDTLFVALSSLTEFTTQTLASEQPHNNCKGRQSYGHTNRPC
jgi:hypothetical protein